MYIRQYAVYTQSPQFRDCLIWVEQHELQYELHLNRTRFWIPEGPLLTEFLLRWALHCELIDCCLVIG
jgi:hypothetical protein